MLLDALVTLAAVSERLEHNDLTIGKLRKLLGIVRSSEKFSDLAGAFGTGDAEADGREDDEEADNAGKRGPGRRKSPPRRKPKTALPEPTVVHHPLTDLERGQLFPGCAHGKLYRYEPSEFTRIVGHPPYSGERHVSEQLRCNGCGEIHGRDQFGAGDVPRERDQRVRLPVRGAATPGGGAARARSLVAVELRERGGGSDGRGRDGRSIVTPTGHAC